MMCEHDLVIIDEVGQLSRWIFERLMRLWRHADRRPAFVLAVDFCKLRGVDPTRACDSPAWAEVECRELKTMRRCQCEELRWKLELLRIHKPSVDQLGSSYVVTRPLAGTSVQIMKCRIPHTRTSPLS